MWLILAILVIIMIVFFLILFFTGTSVVQLMNIPMEKNKIIEKPVDLSPASSVIYDFRIPSLISEDLISFADFKGKHIILLNVASECGYTPQYADWQAFHEKYGKEVIVIGIPSNEFGGQEPGKNEEIASFCQKNYGVSFLMAEKMVVKGKEKHPLYQWLTDKSKNGWNEKEPSWNFCKYVINPAGQLSHFFGSSVLPTDPAFLDAIKKS
jgi:glutathione peroxidase